MQTNLADFIKDTPEGREADSILRSCVHCGFCTATCPTYQLLGDELDGPRGRIYLLKQMLEGQEVTAKTQLHLDRCLTCRACETTCPSGVRYGRLADIGRGILEKRVRRSWLQRVQRLALRKLMAYPQRFWLLLGLARLVRPMLPATLRGKIPPKSPAPSWPPERHARRMLILDGCVQPSMAPSINAAAANVLDKLGISVIRAEQSGCCGALSYHLAAHDEGAAFMRRNIDAWWPHIERGAEAVVSTASGCGVMVKEYGDVLKHDPAYAAKANRISALAKDIGEILAEEDLSRLQKPIARRIAFHSPCTLQNGQKLNGLVERLLSSLGFELTPVAQPHLCCGSAGTYSLLQSELSQKLLVNKIQALEKGGPECIATANIGCWAHLQSKADVPVRHWVELL
ncbi:glycolate oxidase subunit GlcF [Methylocaldum sp.]|uniref:glycolate oxidase subunit GlcF n=1 Tax=Methylocaldum sp. TaxID=1969727 RepID=UPI002D45338A|nr:glycolate oxidase subunit GlcF [Methylocaldum sp.]HYE37859.1 glycolate oxidase subunit GlcF [Methylocaldum sp.]